jgi:hypothetical protein
MPEIASSNSSQVSNVSSIISYPFFVSFTLAHTTDIMSGTEPTLFALGKILWCEFHAIA